MRSLVTGGAGFIGSNLTDALIRRGGQVLVLDDLSTGRRENLTAALGAGADLVVADVAEQGIVASAVTEFRPDSIFHLAAQADVRKAVADPAGDATVNVLGTIHALEAARSAAVPIVYAATGGAVYGEGLGAELPFDEATTALPGSPYGVSKLSGEHYVDVYRRLHGLPAVALRFGNVYGPRQDPRGEAGVVAIFCGRLLAGSAATVFGDGLQTRDYVYVGDTVKALIAASDRLAVDGVGLEGPFNIGTGLETSVLELIERLAEISGRPFEPEFRPRRPGEVDRVSIDPGRAGRVLGWHAETDLRSGLTATLDSVRSLA
jgi:UDP-glucose 4-epimerase